MDHPIERDYFAVFANVAPLLEASTLRALGGTTSTVARSLQDLRTDTSVWKKRFEEMIGETFPAAQQPGKTTWRWKVRTLQMLGKKGLLLSSELMDVQIAISMFSAQELRILGAEIIGVALENNREDIVRYLAIIPALNFKRHAVKAFEGNLAIKDSDSGIVRIAEIPISSLQLLMDPSLGLRLDYVTAMNQAIGRSKLEIVAFLCQYPEEIELDQRGESYLMRAAAISEDIFLYLLDIEGIEPTEDLIPMLRYSTHSEAFLQTLKEHPKTAEFFREDEEEDV